MSAEIPDIPFATLPYFEQLHYVAANYKHSLPLLHNQEELTQQINMTFSSYDLLGRTSFRIAYELDQISEPSKAIFSKPMTDGSAQILGSLQLLHYVEYINGLTAVRGNYPLSKDQIKVTEKIVGPEVVNYMYSLMRIPMGRMNGKVADPSSAVINPHYHSETAATSVIKFTQKINRAIYNAAPDANPVDVNEFYVGMGIVSERYEELTKPFMN